MSLKFAAVGSLTVLGALGARTSEQSVKLAPVEPYYDPLLAMICLASGAAEQKKPVTSERTKGRSVIRFASRRLALQFRTPC